MRCSSRSQAYFFECFFVFFFNFLTSFVYLQFVFHQPQMVVKGDALLEKELSGESSPEVRNEG